VLRRSARQGLDGAGQKLALLRRELRDLEREERLEPGDRDRPLRLAVEPAKRLKRDRRGAEVVVGGAQGLGEEPGRVVAVEEVDAAFRVEKPAGRESRQMGALAGSRRPDDDRVPQIAAVEIEAEGGRALGPADQDGGRRRREELAGMAGESGPERRQRHQVRDRHEVDERSPKVGRRLSGQRAVEGGRGVIGLDPRRVAAVLEELRRSGCPVVGLGAGGA
jgi:hypothetical protein